MQRLGFFSDMLSNEENRLQTKLSLKNLFSSSSSSSSADSPKKDNEEDDPAKDKTTKTIEENAIEIEELLSV